MARIKKIKVNNTAYDVGPDFGDKGSATNPVYFNDGEPIACTYSLNKTVPSSAKFTDTDTTYKLAASTNSTNGTVKISLTPSDGSMADMVYFHGYGATSVTTNALGNIGIQTADATTTRSGLMSASDKTKLDGIAAGAQGNSVTGVKGNSESSYRTGNVNITAANIGLGNVSNTSDANKPVSTAQQTAINNALSSAKTYADEKVANLVNNSTAAVDSITELAAAMENNADAIEALESVAAGKADANHSHDDMYYTESEIDGKVSGLQAEIDTKVAELQAGIDGHTHSWNDLEDKPFDSVSTEIPLIEIPDAYVTHAVGPISDYDIEPGDPVRVRMIINSEEVVMDSVWEGVDGDDGFVVEDYEENVFFRIHKSFSNMYEIVWIDNSNDDVRVDQGTTMRIYALSEGVIPLDAKYLPDTVATNSEVDAALATKADTTHTHAIADVTNLQTTLDSLQADIDGKVAELQADIDGHSHSWSTVSDKPPYMIGKREVLYQGTHQFTEYSGGNLSTSTMYDVYEAIDEGSLSYYDLVEFVVDKYSIVCSIPEAPSIPLGGVEQGIEYMYHLGTIFVNGSLDLESGKSYNVSINRLPLYPELEMWLSDNGYVPYQTIAGSFASKSEMNRAMAKKADTTHTHAIADVTNLQTTLDSLQASIDSVDIAVDNITSGTTVVEEAKHAESADTATNAGHATNADTAASCTGNAATATTASSCTGNAATATTASACSGNSATATKLATAKTISLTGDVTGSTSFDGSGNVSITTTVADDSHNHVISNIDNLQSTLDGKSNTNHTHAGLVNGAYPNGVVNLLYVDSDTFTLVPRQPSGSTVETYLGDSSCRYAGTYTDFLVATNNIQADSGNIVATNGRVQAKTQVYSEGKLTADGNLAVGKNATVDGTMKIGGTTSLGGITIASARIQPYASSQVNLGYSDKRWMNIYSNSNLNVSSDLKVKKDIVEIDDRYIELFDLVQPYAYKFIDGTSGRVHTGFISQHVEEAMEKVGLTAEELAFFCKDIMTEPVYDEDGNFVEDKELIDEDGNPVYYYSLRYGEYVAIMTEKIKRMEQKHAEEKADFEARLSALENKILSMQ